MKMVTQQIPLKDWIFDHSGHETGRIELAIPKVERISGRDQLVGASVIQIQLFCRTCGQMKVAEEVYLMEAVHA